MKVSEVMTAPPVTVPPRVSLARVVQCMDEQGVGCVLVVENGTLCGVVTDRDLAVRGLGGGLDAETPVDKVMSTDLVTVRASADVQEAYRTFRRSAVRRLPVLDGHRPVGVVAVDDLLLDLFRRMADLLGPVAWSVLQEPPGPPGAVPVD
ncbi:CBS domain-containing protein [Streptomyces sp. NPDC001606]